MNDLIEYVQRRDVLRFEDLTVGDIDCDDDWVMHLFKLSLFGDPVKREEARMNLCNYISKHNQKR